MDEATSKKTFRHFARVLIDLDLNSKLRSQILVEREDYAFFACVEYERLLEFYTSCQSVGHSLGNCLKTNGNVEKKSSDLGQISRKVVVPKV